MIISNVPRLRRPPLKLILNRITLRSRTAEISIFASLCFGLVANPLLLAGQATGGTSSQDLETVFRAGQSALRQGDFHNAAEDFKKVLALDPTLVEAEVNLGLTYQSLLDYESAARTL